MNSVFRFATMAVLALATTELVQAQDFSQFQAGPARLDGVAKAVYAGLSDMGDSKAVQQVAFESMSDNSATTARLTDGVQSAVGVQQIPSSTNLGTAAVGTGQITQTSLLSPGCGLPASCGPSCGLPGGCAPGCGAPAPACGLPSAPSCGLPSIESSCGGGGILSGLFGGGGCDSCGGGCDSVGGCDSCGGGGQLTCGSLCSRKCPECCGVGTHYSHVYGEFLYMRSRNTEVTYAVPSNGPIVPGAIPIQVGAFGVVDSDFDAGYRAGVNIALDTVSSLNVRYTDWSSNESDEISLAAPNALESLVSHPSTINTASTTIAARADHRMDLEYIDADYRHLLKCCDVFSANYVIGGRYASLEQGFDAEFFKQPTESVFTDVDFEGGGLRLGLETQRYSCRNQLHVYANGYASFLAGRFRANYLQSTSVDPIVVDAEWDADRLVPILDFEAGIGWTSLSGKLRFNAGYMTNVWFNAITTQTWIEGIQANDFSDVNTSIWFDGLQARVSYQF